MEYVQVALRGDLAEVTNLSFDCISCGLCAMRCPAEIVPYDVAQLARRLYAKYLALNSEHLTKRLKELGEGAFDRELEHYKTLSRDELKIVYEQREIRE
jgi:heterodisulfide reductase subunit C